MSAIREKAPDSYKFDRMLRYDNMEIPYRVQACEFPEQDLESRFSLRLDGVDFTASRGEPVHMQTWNAIEQCIRAMPNGAGIEFQYVGGAGEPPVMTIEGLVRVRDASETEARTLRTYTDIEYSLRSGMPHLSFAPCRLPQLGISDETTRPLSLRPRRIEVRLDSARAAGFAPRLRPRSECDRLLVLPRTNAAGCLIENRLIEHIGYSNERVRVCCRLTRIDLCQDVLQLIERAIKLSSNCEVPEPDRNAAQSLLKAWLSARSGYRIELVVSAAAFLPAPMMEAIADSFFGRRIVMEPHEQTVDGNVPTVIEALAESLPFEWMTVSIVPPPAQLQLISPPRAFTSCPALTAARDGIVLGRARTITGVQTVRFCKTDRSRHCYILGATGTGKSTLLANMIAQDIRGGEGVCVIDPHGDLVESVIASIPPHREKDLVFINPGNPKYVVGLNLLERSGRFREAQMHFIINEFMKMFERLFDIETRGPIFELYMRNALLLLMDNDLPSPTLLDLPRVFEDLEFRRYLMSHSKTSHVVQFWTRTAERTTGEYGLTNMTAYVTSKLNAFVYNGLVRSMVGQQRSTVDFHGAMERRQIVLVKLTKGVLGELDTQLLGMVVVGKIFAAALRRIASKNAAPLPFFLYIDEFQQFCTSSLAQVISESRKFGLYLTLAHQNLAQLKSQSGFHDIGDTILSNAGTLLCFRLGPSDAVQMEPHFGPELNALDLQYLPNFRVAAKLLSQNAPLRPFVFATDIPATTGATANQRRAIVRSYKRHATLARTEPCETVRQKRLRKTID